MESSAHLIACRISRTAQFVLVVYIKLYWASLIWVHINPV